MKFKTEEERMEHPQAKRIPLVLWRDKNLFGHTLDEFLIPFMNATKEELQEGHLDYLLPLRLKKLVCLVIAFSHPEAHIKFLQNIADQLKLNETILFLLVTMTGNLKNISSFLTRSELKESLIKSENYSAYGLAAEYGHLEVLKYFAQALPECVEAMIEAEKFYAFRAAAENGHLDVLKYLISCTPKKRYAMIRIESFYAFRNAAKNGYIAILYFLESQTPKSLEEMIKAENFYAFRMASKNGYVPVLHYLASKLPSDLQAMIRTAGFAAFTMAAEYGQLEVLEYLVSKDPECFNKMINAKDFCAFCLAAENGHLPILKYLESKAPEYLDLMIQAEDFAAFSRAATNGFLEVLMYLESKAPHHLKAMIQSGEFHAFCQAAERGHVEVLKYIVSKVPEFTREMICANKFYAFEWAAAGGHLDVLKYLEFLAPQLIQIMIDAGNSFSPFGYASRNGHNEVVHYMFSKSAACFGFAEQHVEECGALVNPYVRVTLNSLHQAALNTPVHTVFDVLDPHQAQICFYMMRRLIRLNARALDDELRFLLTIPSVKALAHQSVSRGISTNELLRLALSCGNQEAAVILLNIPEVRSLAEANNYYRSEQRGNLDLEQLALDKESSMTALTQGEQSRLEAAIKQYQPKLDKEGVGPLMEKLKAQLSERYEQNPACIKDKHGMVITLPLDFASLKKLHLSTEDYEKALKAYYQHKDHTALRYLSKPNPWMHPHAAYVCGTYRSGLYSTFKEYIPLILMFWLAACDEEFPPIDDMAFEGRLIHFIDELAHIGRAHNWDKTRIKKSEKKEEGEVYEEYDDEEGDRPSCYSGVKRRLFQSVLSHPLISLLTQDMVLTELGDFVRGYVRGQLTDQNRPLFKKAFEDYVDNTINLSESSKTQLELLNIPTPDQQKFTNYLVTKYGAQYSEDDSLRTIVARKLSLTQTTDPITSCHALSLDGLAGIYRLFLPPVKVSEVGFYSNSQPKPEEERDSPRCEQPDAIESNAKGPQ